MGWFRPAVIPLHKMDKLTSKIFTTSKKLKISKLFVYWTFKRLMETGTLVDHPQQSHPCIIRTRRLVQTVAARIQWNPVKKQSVIAWELNIPKIFMSGVLRSDLGLKAYQQSTGYLLTLCLKEQRAIKSKCPNPSTVCMLIRHIVLLIAIRPSDGDVKPGGPLGAFREEQAMSRHRVSHSAFL